MASLEFPKFSLHGQSDDSSSSDGSINGWSNLRGDSSSDLSSPLASAQNSAQSTPVRKVPHALREDPNLGSPYRGHKVTPSAPGTNLGIHGAGDPQNHSSLPFPSLLPFRIPRGLDMALFVLLWSRGLSLFLLELKVSFVGPFLEFHFSCPRLDRAGNRKRISWSVAAAAWIRVSAPPSLPHAPLEVAKHT